ncbi:MAG: hypothetical protein QOF94_2363 [Acidobacteriaceae bacterium]|jgi:hypothetical protein
MPSIEAVNSIGPWAASTTGENDPLPKPKWMRWRTYARKAVELEAPYECYDDALIALRQRSSGIKSDPTRMSSDQQRTKYDAGQPSMEGQRIGCDNGKTSGHDVGDKNDLRLLDCRRPDDQDGADRIRLPLP